MCRKAGGPVRNLAAHPHASGDMMAAAGHQLRARMSQRDPLCTSPTSERANQSAEGAYFECRHLFTSRMLASACSQARRVGGAGRLRGLGPEARPGEQLEALLPSSSQDGSP